MAEPTTHTEVPQGRGKFPPFDPQTFPSQLFWLTLVFVLLYVLMAKVALPRIGTIIEERRKHIDAHLAEAQRFKEQSDAAVVAHDKMLAEARVQAQTVANTVRQQKSVEADEARTRLEAQLRERLAAAEQSIATARSAAMANVKTIAADSAAAIVERLIGRTPSKEEIAAALDEGSNPRGPADT
jgi:F-type H+-transporting ATPase subunit b